jgi:hypothetical protein
MGGSGSGLFPPGRILTINRDQKILPGNSANVFLVVIFLDSFLNLLLLYRLVGAVLRLGCIED